MPKAKAHPDQIGFDWSVPSAAAAPAALAGLPQRMATMVGTILASDGRQREIIAAEMSVLMGEEISANMLNAYSSPARSEHRIPACRLLALLAVTARADLYSPRLREIGADIVLEDEIRTVRLGHVERQIAMLQRERSELKREAPAMRGDAE